MSDIRLKLLSEDMDTFLSTYPSDKLCNTLRALNLLDFDENYTRNISVDDKGVLTYLPKHKESEVKGNAWSDKNRQEASYGKVIRKVLEENDNILSEFTDRDIEKLSYMIKSEFDIDSAFEIVEGETIKQYYFYKSYDNTADTGSLKNSCMRHHKCQWFLDIYVDRAKLVILKSANEGKILGRAIVWENIKGAKFTTYMDRIYGSEASILKFKRYAKSKGWVVKQNQSHSSFDKWISPTGEVYTERLKLDAPKKYTFYPYMDTFGWLSAGGNFYNYSTGNTRGIQSYERGNNPEEFAIQFKSHHSGETYHISEMVKVVDGHSDGYYLPNEVEICSMDEQPHLRNYMISVVGLEGRVFRHNVKRPIVQYGNYHYFQDECFYSSLTGKLVPKNLLTFLDGVGHVETRMLEQAKEKFKMLEKKK